MISVKISREKIKILFDSLLAGIKHRWREITIFLVSCFISSIILFTSPLDPYPEGSDAWYFVILGQRMSDIFKHFPEFITRFLSGGYTMTQYQQMGFVDPTGIYTVFRALVYIFYLAIVITLFGASPSVMLRSQVFLLGMNFVLIYQILSRVLSRRIAFVITILSMFHFSFYLSAAGAESELFLSLFILLTLKQFLLVVEHGNRKRVFLFGLLLMLTSLVKSSMTFLFIVIGIVFSISIYFHNKNNARKFMTWFLAGMFLPALICSILYSRTNNTIGFIEMGLGGRNFYAGQQYYSECFYTNIQYQNKWFVEEAKKISNQVDNRRWFAQYSEVSTEAFKKTMLNDFPRFFAYTLKKIMFLTIFPPGNSYPEIKRLVCLQGNYVMFTHAVILIMALLSIFIVIDQNYILAFFTSVYLYHLAVYGITNIVLRYFISLLPLLVIMAGIAVPKYNRNSFNRYYFLITGMIILLGLFFFGGFPQLRSEYWYSQCLKIVIVNIIYIALIYVMFSRLMKGRKILEYFVPALVMIFIFLEINVFMITDSDVLKTTITAKRNISKTIAMSSQFNSADYDEFYLIIDTFPEEINYQILFNEKPLDTERINKISPVVFSAGKEWLDNERKWTYIKIPPEFVRTENVIEVMSPDGVRLYADYKSKKIHRLPSFVHYIINYEAAYGHIYAQYLDKRVYMDPMLHSINSKTVIDGEACESKNARIYIIGKRAGGYVVPTKYAHLMDVHPFVLTLLRLQDRGLIGYKRVLSNEDTPIKGKMPEVLLGEVDTFNTGYDVF